MFCPFDFTGISDCIPHDHFEAILDVPDESSNSFEWGSWKDFRYGVIPYSGVKSYTIYYLTYSAATTLYISWDFPEGITVLLQGPLGIINYQMPDSGTFTHPYFLQFNFMNLILTYQNVLPVELVSFTASLLNNYVQLYWSTTTETNNSGFEILRKAQNDKEWNSIGFVPGFGTTTEPKSYSFIDENICEWEFSNAQDLIGKRNGNLTDVKYVESFFQSRESMIEFLMDKKIKVVYVF